MSKKYFQAFKQNNTSDLEIFYRENFPIIAKFIVNNNGDLARAKDIFQDSFLTVWENIQKNKIDQNEDISLASYLYRIAKNKWLDHLRSSKNKKVIYVEEVKKALFSPEEIEEKADIDTSYYQKMENSFKLLGDNCQQLLKNFYFKKMTLREIAEQNKWTELTAKNNKYRCLQKLRKLTLA